MSSLTPLSSPAPFALRFILLFTVALTSACSSLIGIEDVELGNGSGGGGNDGGVDGPPSARCNVAPTFGLISSNPSTSSIRRRADGGSSLLFLLNTDPKPDSLSILLYSNMGGHGNLEVPGTYPINASDAKLETCGICALVNTDFDSTASTFRETFMAEARGSLTIVSASPTRLSGRVSSLRFRRVDNSSGVTREISDPCTVTINDVYFDMTYPAQAQAQGTAPNSGATPDLGPLLDQSDLAAERL